MEDFYLVGSHPSPFQLKIEEGIEVVVGRSQECDLCLDSPEISRRHCIVRMQLGVLTLEDACSKIGTRVNDKRVDKATLKKGDFVALSPYTSFRIKSSSKTGERQVLPVPDVNNQNKLTARLPKVELDREPLKKKSSKKTVLTIISLLIFAGILGFLLNKKSESEKQSKLLKRNFVIAVEEVIQIFENNYVVKINKLDNLKLRNQAKTKDDLEKLLLQIKESFLAKENFYWNELKTKLRNFSENDIESAKVKQWTQEKNKYISLEAEQQNLALRIRDALNRKDLKNAFRSMQEMNVESIYYKNINKHFSSFRETYEVEKLSETVQLIKNKKFSDVAEIYENLAEFYKTEKRKEFLREAEYFRAKEYQKKLYKKVDQSLLEGDLKGALKFYGKMSEGAMKKATWIEIKVLMDLKQFEKAKELYEQGDVENALAGLKGDAEKVVHLRKHILKVQESFTEANEAFKEKDIDRALKLWNEVTVIENNSKNAFLRQALKNIETWNNPKGKAKIYMNWGLREYQLENYNKARNYYLEANKIHPKTADLLLEEMDFMAEKLYLKAVKHKDKPVVAMKYLESAKSMISKNNKLFAAIEHEMSMAKRSLQESQD